MAGVLFFYPRKYVKRYIDHVMPLAGRTDRGAGLACRVATALRLWKDQRRKSPAIRSHVVAGLLRRYIYTCA
jgi:hypothetical protein